jgi:beta-galactosidase/beta-glucuronidase
MPATVHDILLQQGEIEAPWGVRGTERCFWVNTRDWVYVVRFTVPRRGPEARLCFQGIENKVDVYLNGKPLASHNSKRPLVVDVSERLVLENVLVLHCHADREPHQGKRNERGSYLGPNPAITSVGVFAEVFLEISSGDRLEEVVADVALNENLTRGTVTVDVTGVSKHNDLTLHLRLLDPDGKSVGKTSVHVSASNGAFNASAVLTVDRPLLWWPRGYGAQPLYRAETTLMVQGKTQEVVCRTLGFRRITQSEPLHFVVNGVPVFLRGGNWVTPNLMSDVWDSACADRLFDLAENAHFNTFRVWGPAPTAPPDAFYEQADARGFLLWQDFPRLPMRADLQSIATCQAKARDTIKRLKHHPSILCWCGINEAAQWAHEDYNKDFTDHGPWDGLAAAEAVGAVCQELDPSRYYQPSSPYYGMNPNDPREGNTHGYTNMWYVPGYDYLNFASEDTRISAPPLHSLQRFMVPEELWPEGTSTLYVHGDRRPFPETWMPYTCAESWKKTGPVEQFYDATNPAELVYRLGMAESLYYRDTVERQRRGRPAAELSDRRCCGGYLVWKYNDSWPQVYSSKVDYFLEPKHVYYALRRAYAPLMLSFDMAPFITLWAINDTRGPVSGRVRIRLYHLEQKEFRKEILREVTIAPGRSKVVVRLDEAGIRAFRKEHILFAEMTDPSGRVLARAHAFADIERRLTFPEAKIDVQVRDGALVLTTDHFARSIYLTGDAGGDAFGWFFEDNYFDLFPGETKVVRVLGDHAQGHITARPWYSSQATTVTWRAP